MEWQKIETAPSYQDVLVYFPHLMEVKLAVLKHPEASAKPKYPKGQMVWKVFNTPTKHFMVPANPTHWMPLPNPPKQQ